MREAAKASHIFSTKNIGKFLILTFEILTKCKLTMSLVLNNRAQVFSKWYVNDCEEAPFELGQNCNLVSACIV